MHRPGVRFAQQATFHPLKYLEPLVRAYPATGVFTHTHGGRRREADDRAGGRATYAVTLVIATHNPVMGTTGAVRRSSSKLALYTSYVLGARVPKGTVPEGLWWDTSDPYDYLGGSPRGS